MGASENSGKQCGTATQGGRGKAGSVNGIDMDVLEEARDDEWRTNTAFRLLWLTAVIYQIAAAHPV